MSRKPNPARRRRRPCWPPPCWPWTKTLPVALATKLAPLASRSRAACAALAALGEHARTAEPGLAKALAHADRSHRTEAADALAAIVPTAAETATALGTAASTTGVPALRALATMGGGAAPAMEGILRALDDPASLEVRYWAAYCVEKLGAEGAPAVTALVKCRQMPRDLRYSDGSMARLVDAQCDKAIQAIGDAAHQELQKVVLASQDKAHRSVVMK